MVDRLFDLRFNGSDLVQDGWAQPLVSEQSGCARSNIDREDTAADRGNDERKHMPRSRWA